MGRAIVITSGKGGVGKSTSTANLGTALAMLGRAVVVVDADVGLRNLDIIMGLESRVVYTSMDVIEGTCDIEKALVKDRRVENLRLLAASQKNNKTDIQAKQMKELCLELKDMFDYVLIDSPAGIEQGFQNASVGADEALIVTTPEVAAVRDADRIIGLLQSMEINDMNLVINRLSPNMVKAGDMMNQQDIIDILSIKLIGVIPEDQEMVVSTNRGLPLTHDRRSIAGDSFKRIARRLEGEELPIPTFKPESWFGSLFDKLFNWG
ncbi:MAG: septum site-determining protein MinD [Candidatus Poribacteria bacterium]|nr:septum site-determining protein MinD [Candidatus Poribacteria bacterium]